MTAHTPPRRDPEGIVPVGPDDAAGPGGSLSGQVSGKAVPVPGEPEGTRHAAASAPPGDPQELRADIERTREQLGQAVEALAEKADVKARARGKASKLSQRVRGTAAQAKEQAKAAGDGMRGQLAAQTATARQKMASAPAKDLLRNRAAAAGAAARKATPAPLQHAAATAAQRRAALAAVLGAAAVLGYLAIRRGRR